MSNVIGFKAFKNTLKRDSGYAPVSGENGYSVIRCVFPADGDWDNISAVSAGFFVHPKDIAGVTAAITADGTERAALFTIPGALLKQGERLHFGLFATVGGVTIATNTVVLDVARGIVSDDIDYDPAEAAGMFEQFSNALNAALLGKANKAAAGTAGELAALDGNGSPIRSGVSVIQSVGEGSNSKVPTTAAVKTALDGKADKAANGTDGELAALDDNGALKRSGVSVAESVGGGSNNMVPTTEAVKLALDGKADKAANGTAGELAALDGNGSPIRSGVSVTLSVGEGSNSKVPTAAAVKTALDGKANKAAAGTAGELAALDANGSPIRSGVSVAESVGEGSNNMVPTTAAVKTVLDGKADKAAAGTVGELAAFDGVGALKRSGFNVAQSVGAGSNSMVPTTAAVKTALDGKADKAPTGAVGELAAVDGNGALIRSGVSVTQSVGGGSNSKVPTTAAVKTALDGKADKLSGGGGGELVSATGGGEIQRSGFFVTQSIGSGAANMLPTAAAVQQYVTDNKPQINGHTLSGDQTAEELGLQKQLTAGEHIRIDPVNGIISGFKVAGWEIAAIDNCIKDGVLYSTSINNQAAYVLARNITTNITQYAFFLDGRVMWRTRQAETPWQPAGEWSAWEEIGGDSEIASASVNQNGIILFYDADGNLLFTTSGANLVTSGNQQISMGYDSGGFYFLFDDGQEAV